MSTCACLWSFLGLPPGYRPWCRCSPQRSCHSGVDLDKTATKRHAPVSLAAGAPSAWRRSSAPCHRTERCPLGESLLLAGPTRGDPLSGSRRSSHCACCKACCKAWAAASVHASSRLAASSASLQNATTGPATALTAASVITQRLLPPQKHAVVPHGERRTAGGHWSAWAAVETSKRPGHGFGRHDTRVVWPRRLLIGGSLLTRVSCRAPQGGGPHRQGACSCGSLLPGALHSFPLRRAQPGKCSPKWRGLLIMTAAYAPVGNQVQRHAVRVGEHRPEPAGPPNHCLPPAAAGCM